MANRPNPEDETNPVFINTSYPLHASPFLVNRPEAVNERDGNRSGSSTVPSRNDTAQRASSIEGLPAASFARSPRSTNIPDLQRQLNHLDPERQRLTGRHAEIRAGLLPTPQSTTDNSRPVNGVSTRPPLRRNPAFTRIRASEDLERPTVNGVNPEDHPRQVDQTQHRVHRLNSESSFLTRTTNAAESLPPLRASNSNHTHPSAASPDTPELPRREQFPEVSALRPSGIQFSLHDFARIGVQGLGLLQRPSAIGVIRQPNVLLVVATDRPESDDGSSLSSSVSSSISDILDFDFEFPTPPAPPNSRNTSDDNLSSNNYLSELQSLAVTDLLRSSSISEIVTARPGISSVSHTVNPENLPPMDIGHHRSPEPTATNHPETSSFSGPGTVIPENSQDLNQTLVRSLDSTVTDRPETSSISDAVTTEHPAGSTSSTVNQNVQAGNTNLYEASGPITIGSAENSFISDTDTPDCPAAHTSSNTHQTSQALRGGYSGPETSSNTSQTTQVVDNINTHIPNSENSSTATHAAEHIEAARTLCTLSDGLTLIDDSSHVTQTQVVNTEHPDPSDSEHPNIPAASTETAQTSCPLSDGITLANDNPSLTNIQGVNNYNSEPSVSEGLHADTNKTAASAEVTNILPDRSDTPSSVNDITYFTDVEGVNHTHPEPRVSVETNTDLTAALIEAANTPIPNSQFPLFTEFSYHHEPSTPTNHNPQATIVSDRFTTPDRPLIGPINHSGRSLFRPPTPFRQSASQPPPSPRVVPTTIRPRRQRRTITTEAGSPVRAGPSNWTAPGAPHSPLWHFNRLQQQNNAASPDYPDHPGPCGPRLNSSPLPLPLPTLRRVQGSESLRALSAEHGQQTPLLAVAADQPRANVFGGQEEEEEQEEELVMEPVGGYAVAEEEDLPAYNPAADDFIEGGEGEEEEEGEGREEGPEGAMVEQARHYLRQVANEVNVLDEIEAAVLVRGSGAAVRARLALLLAEEVVVGALRAALGAVELHRLQAERLFDVAQVLRADGLEAQLRADSYALLLEETHLELAALRRRIQREGHLGR